MLTLTRRRLLAFGLTTMLALSPWSGWAAEQVDLPAPIPKPSQTRWKLGYLLIDNANKRVSVQLIGDVGENVTCDYPTPPPGGSSQPSGATLISTLNTANLTSNSLIKRTFNRVITDGCIAGTVTGTPD